MNNQFSIIQDRDKSISLMHEAGTWLQRSGRGHSIWWQPQNMNPQFLAQHTESEEFYTALINGKPAASMVIQETERNQSWKPIDGENPQKALYLHWLCVSRDFAGQGLPRKMIDFAIKEAKAKDFSRLRLDTEADQPKLCHLYESHGFKLMGTQVEEDGHQTAFYQMDLA
jgi:ribosomal protein S18 acetylase RimI-like enzyme